MARFSRMPLVAGVVAVLVAAAWLVPAGAADPPVAGADGPQARAEAAAQLRIDAKEGAVLDAAADLGPLPWTSYGRERTRTELARWQQLVASLDDAEYEPAGTPTHLDAEVSIVESEAPGEQGLNDTPATGEPVDGFGTGPGDLGLARVSGSLVGVEPEPPVPDPFSVEDDGSIPLANQTAIVPGSAHLFFGLLGDGPHGATTGDMDFWALGALVAGDQVRIETDTSIFPDPPDTLLRLYDGSGAVIGEADGGGFGTDSLLEVVVPADGEYYAMVSGVPTVPADPFDPASGTGPGSVGPYDLHVLVGGGTSPVIDTVEDDGSIVLANALSIPPGGTATFSGIIGDGPFGATSGDVDFFALGEVVEGSTMLVDTFTTGFTLDTLVAVYDSNGTLIASNDDDGFSFDSRLLVDAPATDEYFAAVLSCCVLPADPFDSASGPGAGSTGVYEVELGTTTEQPAVDDVDVFLVDLAPGDALSAGFIGAGQAVALIDPSGTVAQASAFNLSFVYPGSSPLRHTGDIGVDHVASVAGAHAVVVSGSVGGDYQGEIRVVRSGRSAAQVGDQQILFLDFDGAVLDTTVFGPGLGRGSATLSPMSAFLWRWGLSPADEGAVVDAVVATVVENLSADLRVAASNGDRDATGVHGEFDVLILNSRDHPDPWGADDVSRVVVGGTMNEAAIATIGIAQSIDPGNLDSTETALVLLDLLSSRFGGDPSLNAFAVDASTSKVDLVGVGVGNVVAHEAGHILGDWHTEVFGPVPSIMDTGGDLPGLVGVGPDGAFGTGDDIDVDFAVDAYDAFEGLSGDEDTVERTAFALSTGTVVP